MEVIRYTSASIFLAHAREALYRKEVENNLIIGTCTGIIARHQETSDEAIFVNVFEGNRIIASTIKTIPKAVIASFGDNREGVAQLARYYATNGIQLSGVIGEHQATEVFVAHYGQEVKEKQPQFIYSLDTVRDVPHANGHLETASMDDIVKIEDLVGGFYTETKLFARKQVDDLVIGRRFFVWKDRGEITCIAAIIRETDHAGIVGLVYTLTASWQWVCNELREKGKRNYSGTRGPLLWIIH